MEYIEHSDVFPLITDSNDDVLSLPPIINSEKTKITTSTKNILIECTALDITRAYTVLNMVIAMISEYSKIPYSYPFF